MILAKTQDAFIDVSQRQFRGEAGSVEELLASIKDGQFTLDGRKLVVRGNLSLATLGLTSLLGCPQRVEGDFNCMGNKLKTLGGAPQEVGGSFNCNYNGLKTLAGAPPKVGDSFNCQSNQLTMLSGGPQRVGGNFNCSNNQLETLEDGPVEVGNSYDCSNNKLTSLKGLPRTIKGNLWCNSNMLTSLKYCAQTIGGSLYSHSNRMLTSFEGGPGFVGKNVRFDGCVKLTSLQNIHLYFLEVHGWFDFTNTDVKEHILGLLLVRGLQGVVLNDSKLEAILRKYLNRGDILACALELHEAGYEKQAKL
jgi:hypothetical protein